MKAPALDPFEERVRVERLGTALVLRLRAEGPLVLTADDLDRLQRSLGPDPEILGPAKTLRCHLKADIGEVAETDACGSRRPTRAQKRNARPRRADPGENPMNTASSSSRTPRLSEPQLRTIVRKVLGQPFLKGYVSGLAHLGIDASKIEEGALKKLAHLTMKKAPKPGAAARVRKLQKELAAQPNPVLQTEIRRRLAFAELEARGGAR